MAWRKRRRQADKCDEVPDYVRMSRDTLPRRGPFFRAQSWKKRVTLSSNFFAGCEDSSNGRFGKSGHAGLLDGEDC